jgi:site-specific recombinase XerD
MSISKLKTGKYQARVRLPKVVFIRELDKDTDRPTLSFDTRKEAAQFERRMLSIRDELLTGKKERRPENRTINEMVQHYFNLSRFENSRKKTQQTNKARIRHFTEWCSLQGIVYINQFTQEHANEFLKYLVSVKKFKRFGIEGKLIAAKMLFNEDILRTDKSITFNPFTHVDPPRVMRRSIPFYEDAEIEMLWSVMDDKEKAVYDFIMETGIRKEEMRMLFKRRVKDDRVVITDRPDMEWETKTGLTRVVPFTERAAIAARKIKTEYPKGPYFLGGEKMYGSNYLYNTWIDIMARVTARYDHYFEPGYAIHTLRKNFARNMILAGVANKVIAEMMGHTTTRMLDAFYAAIAEDDKVAAVKKLDAARWTSGGQNVGKVMEISGNIGK